MHKFYQHFSGLIVEQGATSISTVQFLCFLNSFGFSQEDSLTRRNIIFFEFSMLAINFASIDLGSLGIGVLAHFDPFLPVNFVAGSGF